MKVFSFIDQQQSLQTVEVEVSLTPGLPTLQFLGRADSSIKESEARIRSALLQQGFDLPAAQQVLVNLRPNHIKKTSKGLDLAVAAAILWETGQLPKPRTEPLFVYGELSLTGEVLPTEDLEFLEADTVSTALLTGPVQSLPVKTVQVGSLKELRKPKVVPADNSSNAYQRPLLNEMMSFPQHQALLLEVIATGEHSALLAGPAGTGKTTSMQQVVNLLKAPNEKQQKEIKRLSKDSQALTWRPCRSPHHSTPPISMVGGGSPPQPGEISRAHGGVLLLDELLEFQPYVLDALREPIESGMMTVSRSGHVVQYPAEFLLLATANLCPCSKYVPGPKNRCRCTLRARRSYVQRLSGPLLDRFQIFTIVPEDSNPYVTISEIFKRVEAAQNFSQNVRQQKTLNRYLSLGFFDLHEDRFLMKNLLPETGGSRRRKLALLRVARTLADLDQERLIQPKHVHLSSQLTLSGFNDLDEVRF